MDDALSEPDTGARLTILLTDLAASLRFYGDALGLRVFRKHLGWYVENAPFGTAATRREIKATLCRIPKSNSLGKNRHETLAGCCAFRSRHGVCVKHL